MNEEVARPAGRESLDVGMLLGQNQAFGLVAGRCSAAQAGVIRRLRKEKLYKSVTDDWREFCAGHLKMSRRSADQIISLLDEFGPEYFEVAQLTRLSAATYRAIQPAIRDGALHHRGEAIALIEANAQQVAAAVAEIRQERKEAAPPRPLKDRLLTLERQCGAIVEEFREIDRAPGDVHRPLLSAVLCRVRLELNRI